MVEISRKWVLFPKLKERKWILSLQAPTVTKGNLLLWSHSQLCVVQYGEVGKWSLVEVIFFMTTSSPGGTKGLWWKENTIENETVVSKCCYRKRLYNTSVQVVKGTRAFCSDLCRVRWAEQWPVLADQFLCFNQQILISGNVCSLAVLQFNNILWFAHALWIFKGFFFPTRTS